MSRRSGSGISWRAASRVLFNRSGDDVLQGVDQREQGRLDDVARASHRGPALGPLARFDEHPRGGRRSRVAVQDAHLVIVQAHILERWKARAERLAQPRVKGVDWTVA